MQLSRTTKIVVAVAVVVGALLFLVLADYGINAGRIHYGVSIGDVNVGGMTEAEAIEALDERAEELEEEVVIFTAEGIQCQFVPEDFNWDPLAADNAEAARRVGFSDFPFGALGDRLRAWTQGVEIEWDTKVRHFWKLTDVIHDCEDQARAIGETVMENILRRRMLIAIVTWPRRNFVVPLEPE
jgi:hypothetical protein